MKATRSTIKECFIRRERFKEWFCSKMRQQLESSFGDVSLVAVTVDIVLSATGAGLDRAAATIIVCTRGIVSGTRSGRSGVGVVVPAGGEVVVVGVIGTGLVMTLHVRPVGAGVSALISDAGVHAGTVGGGRPGIARITGKAGVAGIPGIDLSVGRKDAHKSEDEGDDDVFHKA